MIELKWKDIRDAGFQRALTKVMDCNALPSLVAYRVSKIGKKIKVELSDCQNVFVDLVKKYGDINEKEGSYKIKEENSKDWEKEITEVMDTKFSIDNTKIKLTELANVNLSPNELLALAPILDE